MNDFDVPFGMPAQDALDVPLDRHTGKPMKKVVLVCPNCGDKRIWIEPSTTTLKYGDHTTECDECFLGWGDVLEATALGGI